MIHKTFDQGREEIIRLCRFFDTNRQNFLAPGIKEAHIRQNLIDPFFEALGWDMRNAGMTAPQYREVVTEDTLTIGGQQKAPDYTFRVGTHPLFYVEAKKCGVNIKDDPAPAQQLRRYGWNAKLFLSILTDFEELAVYDCSMKPAPSDKASRGCIMYLRYDQYPEKWRELWDIFSHEAAWSGSFDKYGASKRKRGTSQVDDEFLKEIEAWREALAKNMALRNKALSADDLNAAVQNTIDRIVFLRMAEDRGIEPFEQLLNLCERPGIYERFMKDTCVEADKKYNSGLFHFRKEPGVNEAPDNISPNLAVDDKIFKPILQRLYFEHGSQYQFNVMPVEILGTVYERFLGKVIQLTSRHLAKIEEKPEVRKAGGVYYTPSYIVDYIISQTVGAMIVNKSPSRLAGGKGRPPFRVLDMACGSGSFLLGAYTRLMDHCLNWYVANKPETHKKTVYKIPGGNSWRLTIAEKKRILTTHIYGVDIDPQAVEVTKLSLLLKALEGESDKSFSYQMTFDFHPDRALPNLADNIKCGNALIASNFSMIPEDLVRVRAFDWPSQFPDAMKAGGFDAVIGNPPWVSLSGKFGNEICSIKEIAYLTNRYNANTYMPNLYEYFVTQGFNLTKPEGRFSFIVPDRLGFNAQFVDLRKRLLTESSIVTLKYKIPFPGITADTLIFVLQRTSPNSATEVEIVEHGKMPICRRQSQLLSTKGHEFEYFENLDALHLVEKLTTKPQVKTLGEMFETTSGFGGKSKLLTESQVSQMQTPVMKGDSISKYETRKKYWFEFSPKNITGRTTDRTKLGARPKILFRKTGNSIIATYDDSGIFPEQSLYFLFNKKTDSAYKFVLGILNSQLMDFFFKAKCLTNKDSIAQVKKVDLDILPIIDLNLKNSADKSRHDRLVALVDKMLTIVPKLREATSESEKAALQNAVTTTDAEINRLVYGLYGLTEDEIALVEGELPPQAE